MAFLDDLNKKLSEVEQKARGAGESTKLNFAISDEEKKINQLYGEIGRLYVSNYEEEAAQKADLADLVAAVKEGRKKIEDYRQQIKTLKGFLKCEKCGADIPAGTAFCTACGAPAPKPAPVPGAGEVPCPSCGAVVPKGSRFCTVCGGAMPEEPQPAAAGRVCPGCGATVAEGVAFCTACGTKL